MVWFEYNFLHVLAAEGSAEKSALGDHSKSGYTQGARCDAVSDEARLRYAKNVAAYLCFLAEATGMCSSEAQQRARSRLAGYERYADLLGDWQERFPQPLWRRSRRARKAGCRTSEHTPAAGRANML